MSSGFWFEAGALVPSIGVGLLFWFVLKALLNADRREREAMRRAEEELEATGSGAAESASPDADPAQESAEEHRGADR